MSFLVCVIIRLKSPVTPLALISRVSYGVISCFNDLVLLCWSFVVFYQGFPCSASISGPIVYLNLSKCSAIYKEGFQLIINHAIIVLVGKSLMKCQVDHPFEVIVRHIFFISRIIIRIFWFPYSLGTALSFAPLSIFLVGSRYSNSWPLSILFICSSFHLLTPNNHLPICKKFQINV